jgi:hypothetical protein
MKGQNSSYNDVYNDVNLLMSITCYPWEDMEDCSTNYFAAQQYSQWPITTTNATITSNGNVYTCLS